MEEFGGSLADESVEAEAAANKIMTPVPDVLLRTMGGEIELEGFQSRP